MKKSRTQKAIINTIVSAGYEVISLVVGLVVPRLILSNFGSAYNGITHSISQFISYIAIMKAGIGAATRAALYKPLAEHNEEEISGIIAATQKFMRKVSLIFGVFVIVFACVYPLWVNDFDWLFTSSLIVIISISTFAEYYFGFTYEMLIIADQKEYISSFISALVVILNGIASVILINSGCSIHVVKIASTIISSIKPVFLHFYCRKKYNINRFAKPADNMISQRWDAFAHEIAGFVRTNSDIVILTFFSNLLEISVYTVYHYVTENLKKVLTIMTSSFAGAFGNMYAKEEKEIMNENFGIYELIVYSVVSVFYSVTLVMIVPFVMLYTKGVNDVNYSRPLFAMVLTLGSAFECYRLPYKTMIKVAGHFKQTRNGAILEAAVNIAVSCIGVIFFGLVAVALGTLCAMILRTCEFAYYNSRNIMHRDLKYFISHLLVSLLIMLAVVSVSRLYMPADFTIVSWILYASVTTVLAVALTVFTDLIFYKTDFLNLFRKLRHNIMRKV